MTTSWQEATREEFRSYYTETFPEQIERLPSFVTAGGPKQYAVSFREAYPTQTQNAPDRTFIRRDTWQTNESGDRTAQQFNSTDELIEFIQSPARSDPAQGSGYALADPDLLDRPEPRLDAVYYALDHWERPWVLAVDIDAKDIAARRAARSMATVGLQRPSEPSNFEMRGSSTARPRGIPTRSRISSTPLSMALPFGRSSDRLRA